IALHGRLDVRDGGSIAVDTLGTGHGGNIAIGANEVFVSSGGAIAARTLGQTGGGGGDLAIGVAGRLEVAAGGEINAGTFGSGRGGSISIHGNEVLISGRDARVSAVSGSPLSSAGAGGDLFLKA